MTRIHTLLRTSLTMLALAITPGIAAEGRWFAGAAAGRADVDDGRFAGGDRFLRAAAGRRLNSFLAVEGAWIDVGEARDVVAASGGISLGQDTLTVRGRGLTLGPVLSWRPVAPLELSLRLGLSVLDVDRRWSGGTVVDPDLAADAGGTDSGFFAGARIAGRLGDAFSVGLNLDRYELGNLDVDATYVDVRVHF